MFAILENNGSYIMGLVLNTDGNTKTWNTRKSALSWAKRNCAFEWQVIEL